jgi:hypothetical protein
MRHFFVATLLGALSIGEASAEDNGQRLFQMFQKTCAGKPVSGEALDARARGLGYVHPNGPVAPDDLKRNPDDIHSWRLPEQGSNFAIDAYFAGPRTNYRIVCAIHADNVDIAGTANEDGSGNGQADLWLDGGRRWREGHPRCCRL